MESKSAAPLNVARALEPGTAGALQVRLLYRFQKFDSAKVALLLAGKTLRMSSALYFNDPYDCRPWFHPDALATDEKLESFIRFVRAGFYWAPDDARSALEQGFEIDAQRMREKPDYRTAVLERFSRAAGKAIDEQFRLLCFSTDPTDPVLWAHYGDAHRGICLVFRSSVYPFGTALKVNYEAEYPIPNFNVEDPGALAQFAFLTKSKRWETESEFRMISAEIERTIYVRSQGGYIDVAQDALAAIIVGMKSPPNVFYELRYLIKKYSPKTELIVAHRDLATYQLQLTSNAIDSDPHKPH